MKLINISILGLIMCLPNIVFAHQSNVSFEVSFTVLPSCSIKTDKIIDQENNLKIISNCSHEDFYVTTHYNDKDSEINYHNVATVHNISRIKNITNNEVHALVHDVNMKKENTIVTINF